MPSSRFPAVPNRGLNDEHRSIEIWIQLLHKQYQKKAGDTSPWNSLQFSALSERKPKIMKLWYCLRLLVSCSYLLCREKPYLHLNFKKPLQKRKERCLYLPPWIISEDRGNSSFTILISLLIETFFNVISLNTLHRELCVDILMKKFVY